MLPRSLAARVTALGSFSATMCGALTGSAEPGHASVRVECPALGNETRAVVEARAQAELVSEPLLEGEVSVTCGDTTVTLVWAPKEGARRERQVELTGGGETVDDLILAALHALLFEQSHAPPSPVEPRAETTAPREPPPLAPQPPEESELHRIRVADIAGADAELWQGGILVALGAYVGIAVSPWKRWTLSLAIAPQWGVGTVDGITAWGLRGVGRVDYTVLSRLELSVGASGRSLWANAANAANAQLEGATGGAILAARYVLPLGPVRLSAGPRLEALVRPIIAEFSGREVFRVPSFVVGLTLDIAAPEPPQ